VRDAWRNDSMSEDTENTALDLFGALLTPGDHKARMDLLLYGSEDNAALRAAKRLGANHVALAKARIAAYKKASNTRALLEAVRANCTAIPATSSARSSCCAVKRSSPRPRNS